MGDLHGARWRGGRGGDELCQRHRRQHVADIDPERGPDGSARLVGVREPALLGHPQHGVGVLPGEAVDRVDLSLEQVRRRGRVAALDADRDDARGKRDDERDDVAQGDLDGRGGRQRSDEEAGSVVDGRQERADTQAGDDGAPKDGRVADHVVPMGHRRTAYGDAHAGTGPEATLNISRSGEGARATGPPSICAVR